jgi:hypothetical protein
MTLLEIWGNAPDTNSTAKSDDVVVKLGLLTDKEGHVPHLLQGRSRCCFERKPRQLPGLQGSSPPTHGGDHRFSGYNSPGPSTENSPKDDPHDEHGKTHQDARAGF